MARLWWTLVLLRLRLDWCLALPFNWWQQFWVRALFGNLEITITEK